MVFARSEFIVSSDQITSWVSSVNMAADNGRSFVMVAMLSVSTRWWNTFSQSLSVRRQPVFGLYVAFRARSNTGKIYLENLLVSSRREMNLGCLLESSLALGEWNNRTVWTTLARFYRASIRWWDMELRDDYVRRSKIHSILQSGQGQIAAARWLCFGITFAILLFIYLFSSRLIS